MDTSTQNTLSGITANIPPNQEQVQVTDDAVFVKMTEAEFSEAVDKQLIRIEQYESEVKIKKRQATNKLYFEGDQLDLSSLRDDQEKWVENALLRNIETLVSIYTSQIPEQTATPAYKNDKTRAFAATVRRIGQTEWEVRQAMQPKVSKGIRNHQKNLVAVFQLGYDPETKRFWTEEVPATELKISKHRDFIVRYIKDKDLGYLLDLFPNKANEIKQYYGIGPGLDVTKKMRNSPVEFIQVWTDEVIGWRLGQNLVLDLQNNPHFDYDGQEFSTMNPDGTPNVQKVFFNHFEKPKAPFLFLNHINTTGHTYDDTTLLEQGIGLQNWINKRKRQIGENADAANGVWVTSGDFISEEEFMKIEGGINEKIWLENGMPANGIARITGNSLEDFVYNDLLDSRNALNQLMGVENATLGAETNNKTLGQDVMQRQQNVGRAGGYVRDGIEKLAQEWYEYMYHMYLVYRTDEESIAVPEDDDIDTDNVIFSRSSVPVIQKKDGTMIPVPIIIRVKGGSTLPKDEIMDYNRAQQNKDLYAPIDYFKKIGESNPRELAKNKLVYDLDPTWAFKDDPDVVQITQAMAQKAQMAAQAAGGPTAPPIEDRGDMNSQPAQDPNGSNPKGVANAMQAIMKEKGISPDQLNGRASAALN